MAKKITVEVDAETSKAKRKLEELATSGSGTAGADNVAASANRAAKALDATAKNVQSLGREAAGSSAQMRTLFRSFAGLGASMAAGYAANYMSPGVGKTSMGYLSSMAAGASTGAAIGSFIPGVGTVVGAGVGAAVGSGVGAAVGASVSAGTGVGADVGSGVAAAVGAADAGSGVVAGVGSSGNSDSETGSSV